jgi:hypothetical protein
MGIPASAGGPVIPGGDGGSLTMGNTGSGAGHREMGIREAPPRLRGR